MLTVWPKERRSLTTMLLTMTIDSCQATGCVGEEHSLVISSHITPRAYEDRPAAYLYCIVQNLLDDGNFILQGRIAQRDGQVAHLHTSCSKVLGCWWQQAYPGAHAMLWLMKVPPELQ